MSRRNYHSWEQELMSTGFGIAFIVVLVVVGLILTLLWLTVTELFKIYRSRATGASPTSRFLWGALAGLFAIVLLAGLYASTTHDGVTSLILVSWSSLGYVLFCLYIDWQARKNDQLPEELLLADVVSWQSADVPVEPDA